MPETANMGASWENLHNTRVCFYPQPLTLSAISAFLLQLLLTTHNRLRHCRAIVPSPDLALAFFYALFTLSTSIWNNSLVSVHHITLQSTM
jgi:hypothetical protein